MSYPGPPVPRRQDVPAPIRECYCNVCGLIAPSWFHSSFLLTSSGFTCIWCSFPDKAEGERPVEWGYRAE